MVMGAERLAGVLHTAIPPLVAAAALSDDGELDVPVARFYMDTYQWQPAALAARKAIRCFNTSVVLLAHNLAYPDVSNARQPGN